MSEILHNALAGMANASTRLNEAAKNIVQAAARGASGVDARQGAFIPSGPGVQASATPARRRDKAGEDNTGVRGDVRGQAVAAEAGGLRYVPSLAEEIVQLKIAASAYKANAALVRTADEILQTTIDSLSPGDKRR
ncbi:MAG: flagellar basal body rod C-terminal domain-containing protein [Pseudomonadota bacterium]|jgi:flagellar basal body rod protein FlgC